MKNKIFTLFILLILINFLSGEDIADKIKEGIIYLNSGDYEKSIKVLEEAKKYSSQNSDIYYYLGEAYFRKGDIQKASTNLQKAIEMNPQNQSYYYTLAYVYLSQNKNKEAIELLDKIIKISPLSFYGKQAMELKEKLESKKKDAELAEKWGKIEIEEKKKKEEEKKEKKTSQPTERGEMQKEERIPIDKLVRRIKFGTEDERKTSSNLLLNYSPTEISKVIKDIIEIIKKEEIKEIRKNLILASGKVNSPEVIQMLLEILKNNKELFEVKLVAIDSLENIKSEKIVPELRNIFAGMVDKRRKEKEEAKRNLEQVIQEINISNKKKVSLNEEIEKMNSRLNEINSALGIATEEQFIGGFEGRPKVLSEKEKQKLNEEKKTLEEKITKSREDVQKIEIKINELEKSKNKYETLIALREKKIDISGIGSSKLVIQETGPQDKIQGESGAIQPQITYSQTEIDEEKNEIILCIKLMNFLANMRDKESLTLIKNGWNEFGVSELSIYYYIALGKLGEYTNINDMVLRLKKNYPKENIDEEINIRKNIIEVLGEYIKNKPNIEIRGLIEYLAEECEYIQIKNTAKQVLSKTGA